MDLYVPIAIYSTPTVSQDFQLVHGFTGLLDATALLLKMGFRDRVLESLGSKIRKERLEKGMSQEELSHRAGLDRSYVGGVERGERNVSAVNLVRIAVGIGVPVSSFFSEVDSEIKSYEHSDLPR